MQDIPLLCTVCGYRLENTSLLREHYRTDWHNYNQKRKLANREPISEASFNRKLELLNSTKTTVEKGNSHIKQKINIVNNDVNKTKDVKLKQIPPYNPTYCYFDNTVHPTVEECFEYMKNKYSFIIPDREYLVEFEGLALYLGEKLFEGHICLYCDKMFSSLMAVRDHMISLGHTMLGTHLDVQKEELERFYNYSASYKELIPNFNKMSLIDNNEDQDEWEYIDDDYQDDNNKEFYVEDVLNIYNLKKPFITEYGDLRLPNGKEVVHRDLAYIYKQRVPNKNKDNQIILETKMNNKRINIYDNYNLNRIYINKTHLKQNLLLNKRIKSMNLKTGVNNNKLQKYFVRRDIIW